MSFIPTIDVNTDRANGKPYSGEAGVTIDVEVSGLCHCGVGFFTFIG